MNQFVSEVRQTMANLNIPLEKRSLYLTVAVAKAVAYLQPLPTSKLESAIAHYNATILENVQHTLAGINEALLLDVNLALQLTFKVWLMRYRIAHEPTFVSVNALLNNIAEVDRATLASVYGDVFADQNGRTIDILVSSVGSALQWAYRRILPEGANNV